MLIYFLNRWVYIRYQMILFNQFNMKFAGIAKAIPIKQAKQKAAPDERTKATDADMAEIVAAVDPK